MNKGLPQVVVRQAFEQCPRQDLNLYECYLTRPST